MINLKCIDLKHVKQYLTRNSYTLKTIIKVQVTGTDRIISGNGNSYNEAVLDAYKQIRRG